MLTAIDNIKTTVWRIPFISGIEEKMRAKTLMIKGVELLSILFLIFFRVLVNIPGLKFQSPFLCVFKIFVDSVFPVLIQSWTHKSRLWRAECFVDPFNSILLVFKKESVD